MIDRCGVCKCNDVNEFDRLWAIAESRLCKHVAKFETEGLNRKQIRALGMVDQRCSSKDLICDRGRTGAILVAICRLRGKTVHDDFMSVQVALHCDGSELSFPDGSSSWESEVLDLAPSIQALDEGVLHVKLAAIEHLTSGPSKIVVILNVTTQMPVFDGSPVKEWEQIDRFKFELVVSQADVVEQNSGAKESGSQVRAERTSSSTLDEIELDFVLNTENVDINSCRVVGGVLRHNYDAKSAMVEQKNNIIGAIRKDGRSSFSIWGASGWGKTYFVGEIAKAISTDALHVISLTSIGQSWRKDLVKKSLSKKETIVLVDELDKQPSVDNFFHDFIGVFDTWPDDCPAVFVAAGAHPDGAQAMFEQLKDVHGGNDFLTRMDCVNSHFEIPEFTRLDCVVVFVGWFLQKFSNAKTVHLERMLVYWIVAKGFASIREITNLCNEICNRLEMKGDDLYIRFSDCQKDVELYRQLEDSLYDALNGKWIGFVGRAGNVW